MNVVIERAGLNDAAAIADVHIAGLSASYQGRVRDLILATPADRVQTRIWRQWLQRSRACTLVARIDGAVVGFCSFHSFCSDDGEGTIGEIPVIAVHPSQWRRGVGRTLCDHALAEAWRRLL